MCLIFRISRSLADVLYIPIYSDYHLFWLFCVLINDILNSIDQHKVVLPVLLSAAFDTIDHEVLINRLSPRLGLSGCVLDLFRSCLNNRSQRVKLDNVLSDRTVLRYGVPQGLVLFLIYVLPLCYIINKYGLAMLTTLSRIYPSRIILLSQRHITPDAFRHVSRK